MEGDEVAPVYPRAPGAVDLGDDAAVELKAGIGRVFRITIIRFAVFVPAILIVDGAETTDGAHRSEDILQHVTPMAKHI